MTPGRTVVSGFSRTDRRSVRQMPVTPQGDNGRAMSAASASFIAPDALLSHWQGHRRLTRRVIDAFPDDKLFTFSVGGMRTFGELSMELITMGAPMLRGLTTGQWDNVRDRSPRPKQEVLRLWDEATPQIDALWKQMPAERFRETASAAALLCP